MMSNKFCNLGLLPKDRGLEEIAAVSEEEMETEPLPNHVVLVDKKNQLGGDFKKLLNNSQMSDVTFVLEGSKFVYGHRVILAARSQMFRALLFGGMRESTYSITPPPPYFFLTF